MKQLSITSQRMKYLTVSWLMLVACLCVGSCAPIGAGASQQDLFGARVLSENKIECPAGELVIEKVEKHHDTQQVFWTATCPTTGSSHFCQALIQGPAWVSPVCSSL